MALNPVTTYLKYANLQMAAESNFGKLNSSWVPGDTLKADNITQSWLTNGNERASKFPPPLAAEFIENWSVVEHIANTATGFSGTLFKARQPNAALGITEGELVLSFRSTEFADDYVRDNRASTRGQSRIVFA